MEDIIAYHHTNKVSADSILRNGFNPEYFKNIHLGFGVQCFLERFDYPKFNGKVDGQLEVKFDNCRIWEDKVEIERSIELIRCSSTQRETAQEEADRIKRLDYDAYKYKIIQGRIIVFLNLPEPVKWIEFKN